MLMNQLIFMKDAYRCFDESLFGLFESPTGSGKTLSILCSALTWLKNNRSKTMMCDIGLEPSRDEEVPEWVSQASLNHKKKMVEDVIKDEAVKLEELRKKVSDRLDTSDGKLRIRENYKRLLTKPESDTTEENKLENLNKTQIIICSRTFSQLNQYVKEFKQLNTINRNIRLAMGTGRSQVCINKQIKSKCKTPEELNDECRRSKCEFRSNTTGLSEIATCYPLDLEDLVRLGKDLGNCPYYSNLTTIPNADIVLAPYVTVINESLRESLGLRIKDNILIFDEGHNLTDALTESHASKLTLTGLKQLLHQLGMYVSKYGPKFNELMTQRVSEITKFVVTIVENLSKPESSQSLKITAFTVKYALEDIKFHEILNFLSSTDFCRHMRGLAEREYHFRKKKNETIASYTSMVYNLKNFVHSLLYCGSNDEVIITKSEDISIEIFPVASVGESRSVIVMSGTLSPIEEFLSLAPSRAEVFIHRSLPVFPLDRLLSAVIHKDENGDELVFDYSRRENLKELKYLCTLMEIITEIVPGGIVCFFSSYAYLDVFYKFFLKSSSSNKVLLRKHVFKEQKNVNIFPEYSECCAEKGAILFAVFGGSQSEGVDFSDDLARLVLLVGLPYPPDNIKLKLKREYYNKKCKSTANTHTITITSEAGEQSVSENYSKLAREQRTLLCYKTVNQCIGRAMRHRDDFSGVVLLDSRYKGRDADKYLTDYVKKSISMNENKTNDLRLMLKNFYQKFN
uniref:DNA helicase, putative n=1 Tax=Theileria parva TaxID=5875 RepID=Q4MZ47_THEPA|eukprot:XP_762768.1 DNA helicase [Theileria parva strain Muguga]